MPAELRTKVKTYINTLNRNKQWKSTCPAPSQPTALVTDKTAKPRTSGKQTDDKDAIAKLKAKNAAWKFDHSKSSGKTYTKNEKTYHWCTGPGHSKVGMWVIHEPALVVLNPKAQCLKPTLPKPEQELPAPKVTAPRRLNSKPTLRKSYHPPTPLAMTLPIL